MLICAELFVSNLKSKNLTYDVQDLGDKTLVSFPYQNMKILFLFAGQQGEQAQLITSLEHVPEDKFVDLVLACNQLNNQFRFIKFTVDKDNDVMARADAILDTTSAGDECFELLIRSLQIIQDAKPLIMKSIYA